MSSYKSTALLIFDNSIFIFHEPHRMDCGEALEECNGVKTNKKLSFPNDGHFDIASFLSVLERKILKILFN